MKISHEDAGAVSPSSGSSKVPGLLSSAITERITPGAVLSVSIGTEYTVSTAAGTLTYEPGSPKVSADTIYDIASLTKVVATTSMAMILFDRGRFGLEQPVAEFVPEFAAGKASRERVTFRMLLAHTSGLPGYVRLFEQVSSREELLARCFSMPLETEPGTRAEYSDVGFIILGAALERIAAEALDSFSRREIFAPLEMSSTQFRPAPELRNTIPPTENDLTFRRRIVQGEVHDENAWVLGGVAGHAGIFSSAKDLSTFARCMIAGGAPILKPDTIALFTGREESPAGTSRALGWDTPSRPSQSGKYFSPNSFGHLGFTGTSLWIDLERRVSITLLTNRTWPDRSSDGIRQLRPAIHDAVMETLGHPRQ